MRRFWRLFLIFTICITGASAEKLESGKAYIVSSINVNSTGNVEAGKSYSLVPQVVIATGSEDYAGSVTLFTGCYDGKRYEKGIYQASCLTSVIDSLDSTSTNDALSAAKGKDLQTQINELVDLVNNMQNSSLDVDSIYPVGSIYMSMSNTKTPDELFGGTWEALDQGRVLIGANSEYTAGSIGGEKTISHTHNVTASGTVGNTQLTVDQIPGHTHTGPSHTHGIPALSGSTSSNGSHYHTGTTSTNGNHTHNMSSVESSSEFWVRSSGYGGINQRGEQWSGDRINIGSIQSAGNHEHTFTTSTVSNHNHTLTTNASTTGGPSSGNTGLTGGSKAHNHSFTGSAVTSTSTTINNMQPYLAVYMWKRVA